MEPQTDGPEWVLASLFVVGFLVVIVAAVREVRALRRGDRRGEDEERRR
jgi:hypothetical protein